jgi:DNA-binding transcriptional ArsR family regulator
MNPSALERVVKHDGRLNVLCCLLDEGPLSVTQIAARIGETPQAVRYWLTLLHSFGVVEQEGTLDAVAPLYTAALADQPEWVRTAVREHRPRAS